MHQDYKLKIEFENCSYDSPYLVEGCANSCIKLQEKRRYGWATNRLSCRPNGLSMLLPEQATICLSGEWQEKILITMTWIKYLTRK